MDRARRRRGVRCRWYSDPGERGQGPKPARRQRDEREAARRDRGRMKRKQEGRSRSGDGRPRGAEGGARSCRQSLRCCRARCCRCRFCFTCKMWVRTSPGALPAWPLPGEALVCRRNPAGIVCLSQPRAATAWSALESPRRWSSRGSRRRRLTFSSGASTSRVTRGEVPKTPPILSTLPK